MRHPLHSGFNLRSRSSRRTAPVERLQMFKIARPEPRAIWGSIWELEPVALLKPQNISGIYFKSMAEREGFEPPIGLHLCRISSAVLSTTQPPLRVAGIGLKAVAVWWRANNTPSATGQADRGAGTECPPSMASGHPKPKAF